jgi:hypothetical protein
VHAMGTGFGCQHAPFMCACRFEILCKSLKTGETSTVAAASLLVVSGLLGAKRIPWS